jgi:hypothetical protein
MKAQPSWPSIDHVQSHIGPGWRILKNWDGMDGKITQVYCASLNDAWPLRVSCGVCLLSAGRLARAHCDPSDYGAALSFHNPRPWPVTLPCELNRKHAPPETLSPCLG